MMDSGVMTMTADGLSIQVDGEGNVLNVNNGAYRNPMLYRPKPKGTKTVPAPKSKKKHKKINHRKIERQNKRKGRK
jgi:hypothetical protein